ncbi:MAG TPA: hypothetical protein VHA07_13025 [Devosia sp.]|nr:hypothetical protein [Devosia sp.]
MRLILPQDAENSHRHIASYHIGDSACDPAFFEMCQKSLAASLQAGAEDDAICEAVQRARRSPAHFYSPFWGRVHLDCNRMVLGDLEGEGR